MRIRLTIFLLILMVTVLTFQSSRASRANAPRTSFAAYLYVEVETKVYRKGIEISSENREERRWYFSNVVEQPEDVPSYSLVKQKFMPYFSRNVMDPFREALSCGARSSLMHSVPQRKHQACSP